MIKNVADICLVLEGSYPYVSGGVSSWVHQLVSGLPDFTFALAVITPDEKFERKFRYDLPNNVIAMHEMHLHGGDLPRRGSQRSQAQDWQHLRLFHNTQKPVEKSDMFKEIFANFFDADTRKYAPNEILNMKKSWELLKELYASKAPNDSFLDYFWSIRFIHQPLFKVLCEPLPEAHIYHAVSTGYAGLWAALGKIKYGKSLLLTEHGIYTRERRIEISRAEWIYEKNSNSVRLDRSYNHVKHLWNKMFGFLSRLCYHYADEIITLTQANLHYQIEEGADRQKLRIIPNGVDVEKLSRLDIPAKDAGDPFVIGFMGRVVSIKDVKTFIRACKTAAHAIPRVKVLIMGPTDEEPAYYEDCKRLVHLLELENIVTFTGKVDIEEYFPLIDIMVLTSISESQPLVILEANCIGIPCVATDVGACRELLEGATTGDKALGESGLLAGVTNTREIAEAIIKLYESPTLRGKMGESGRKRVAKYYSNDALEKKYRALYLHYKKQQATV
ncbi:MAG: GT4 family glycosyltransferase PelF [Deferribacteres bacterium]|nr:GT4 family glycosyltransferase PelF [candidate division KSB1 bacterium]MCB9502697.1 GT4 family glycosyltransferase PelF [Deferribacteres bacterium]